MMMITGEKRFFLLFTALLFITICTGIVAAKPADSQEVAFMTRSGNIYKELNPESEVLRIAPKHSHYVILESSNEWVRVKTDEGPGWISRINCRVDKRANLNLNHRNDFRFLIFLGAILIAVIVGLIIFFNYRNRDLESDVI
ncbi:MAG: hypothetical protein ACQEQV_02395 [Fibrobacterota bacterium]